MLPHHSLQALSNNLLFYSVVRPLFPETVVLNSSFVFQNKSRFLGCFLGGKITQSHLNIRGVSKFGKSLVLSPNCYGSHFKEGIMKSYRIIMNSEKKKDRKFICFPSNQRKVIQLSWGECYRVLAFTWCLNTGVVPLKESICSHSANSFPNEKGDKCIPIK